MSINRGMDEDVVRIYNGILLCHWKEWNNAMCCNMGGSRECHVEWSQSDREGEIAYDIPYMWNLKRHDVNELAKQKETHRLREWTYCSQGEGWKEGIVREFGMDMYTLLHLKWITNKALLYSTYNFAQCYVAAWTAREFGGEWIHVGVWLSPFTCLTETITTLVNQLYSNKK